MEKFDDRLNKLQVIYSGEWENDMLVKGYYYAPPNYTKMIVKKGIIQTDIDNQENKPLNSDITITDRKETKEKTTEPKHEGKPEETKLENPAPQQKNVHIVIEVQSPKAEQLLPTKIKPNKIVPQIVPQGSFNETGIKNEPNNARKLIRGKTSGYFIETSSFQENLVKDSKKIDYSSIRVEKLKNPKKELSIEDSIGLLIDCISQGQIEAKKAHEKDVIIFIGNTGAGKSTMVNFLYGCEMQEQSAKELQLKLLEPVITVKGKELMPIGHTKQSKTFMPQIENDAPNNFTYIDCPGFLDNRGPEINIANAVNIKNAIKEAKSVKVIILISYASLKADRSRGLNDMLKISSSLFGNSDNLVVNKGSILIGISNIPQHLDLETLKDFLIEDSPSEMEILAEKVFTFDPLERKLEGGWSRTEIIENIKNLKTITTHRKIFSTVLTNEDEKKLMEIGGEISKKILSDLNKTNVGQDDFKSASYHLFYLQSLDIIEHPTVYRMIVKNRDLITKALREMATEVFYLSSFEKFEQAEKIIEVIKSSLDFFDKTIQSCVDLEKLQKTIDEFKEKKVNQEKKEKTFQDKIKSAEDKADEVFKLLSEEKQKTEKQLQEQNITISRLLQENEANMKKELAKYEGQGKLLENDYEFQLRKKEAELRLTPKEDREEVIQEIERLKSELADQKVQLAHQKMEYEEEQNKIIKNLRDKQEKEKQLTEKKLKEYEQMIKEKEIEFQRPEENEGERLCEEGKSFYIGNNENPQDFERAFELFYQSANLQNEEAFYWIGIMYEKGKGKTKDIKVALKYFNKAAKLGYSWGFNKLGQLYQNGEAVEKNEAKAYEMYQKAWEMGCNDENLETRLNQLNESKKLKESSMTLKQEARKWYSENNHDQAFILYLQSAKLGNRDSMYQVGEMYRNGKGVEGNYLEAMRFFKMAAELNHELACFELGEMFEKGEGGPINEEEAIKFYAKSIELGCSLMSSQKLTDLKLSFEKQLEGDKLFTQGAHFQNGENGQIKDLSQSVIFFSRAADLGHAKSWFSLGEMYKNGWGVQKGFSKAFECFEKAAKLGEARAYLMIGEFYQEGYEMRKDFQKAMENYAKARKLGLHGEAGAEEKIKNKKEMYEKGEELFNQGEEYEYGQNGKERNYQKALDLYLEAGNLGYADGFHHAACLYRFGNLPEKNWKEALKLYLQSGGMGNESSYYCVGLMYYGEECGGQKDYSQALKYFEKAAEMKDHDSLVFIARIYKEGGPRIVKDNQKAIHFYQKALFEGVLSSEKYEEEARELI